MEDQPDGEPRRADTRPASEGRRAADKKHKREKPLQIPGTLDEVVRAAMPENTRIEKTP